MSSAEAEGKSGRACFQSAVRRHSIRGGKRVHVKKTFPAAPETKHISLSGHSNADLPTCTQLKYHFKSIYISFFGTQKYLVGRSGNAV